MMSSHARLIPRLSFTGRHSPRLDLNGDAWEVVDLSPHGARLRQTAVGGLVPIVGEVVSGTIHFPAGRAVVVKGRVLRTAEREVALGLTPGRASLAGAVPMGPPTSRRIGLLW